MTTSKDYINKIAEDNTLIVIHTNSTDHQSTKLIGKIETVFDDSLVLAKGKYNEIIIFFNNIVAIREWTEDTKTKR